MKNNVFVKTDALSFWYLCISLYSDEFFLNVTFLNLISKICKILSYKIIGKYSWQTACHYWISFSWAHFRHLKCNIFKKIQFYVNLCFWDSKTSNIHWKVIFMFDYYIILVISVNINSNEDYSGSKYTDPIKTIPKKIIVQKIALDIH